MDFAPPSDAKHPAAANPPPWTVLVVDDDASTLAISRMAMRSLEVAGRRVNAVTAESAAAALKWLDDNGEPALLLVDMQLESADAGLRLIAHIRGERAMHKARIVMRSGGNLAAIQAQLTGLDVSGCIGKSDHGLPELRATIVAALAGHPGSAP